jgi:hypothetical protein
MQTMREVLQKRIDLCRRLGIENNNSFLDGVGWFSFLRSGPSHEPHLRSTDVPVIVISGGCALKIVREFSGRDGHRLAWHPANLRNEPLYLLVHRLDFIPYVSALRGVMAQFPNMHVIGWDGGKMTGFGAARAAALAFADSLPYRPGRILMMDQDVVLTNGTRHTSAKVIDEVTSLHEKTNKPIVGYGVGYPTRRKVPGPFEDTGKIENVGDLNSPAQQFVSIMAPFRRKLIPGQADGIYPTYMVAGGEDMLAGFHLEMMKDDCNVALRKQVIIKKELAGPADPNNQYWNVARVETLKRLYAEEKKTKLKWNGLPITLQHLMMIFSANSLIKPLPDPEVYNTAACVIERIILRLHKLEPFSPHAVFLNRKR